MHETHQDAQDMACDILLKTIQKCKREFVTIRIGANEEFVSKLLSGLPSTIADLEPY